jgi:cytochrome P450
LIHHIERNLPDDEPDRTSATAHLLTVVLVMGNDALAGCITYPVRHMLGDDAVPDRAPPQSAWGAISDDAIRYASPVGFSTRRAVSDTEVGGYPLKAGDIVSIAPFAADRDPAVFEHPGHITPRPKLGVGMAFAAGAHVCVGLRLTRSIVHCAYKALAELPPLKASGSVSQGEGQVVRMLTSCPVEFR